MVKHYYVRLIFVFLLAGSGFVFARGDFVARIQCIADISQSKPMKIKTDTDKVMINRYISGDWIYAQPKTQLFRQDQMLVQKNMRVAVQLKRKNQRGKLYFLPNALEAKRDEAIYEFIDYPAQPGRVDLYIAHGSLIIDWEYGQIGIIANSIQVLLEETKAMFEVDSLSGDGYVYILSGSVTFPEYPGMIARPQDKFRLRSGQAPEKMTTSLQHAAQLKRFINYNSRDLWSAITPFWQKPVFYVPAAAGTGIVATTLFIAAKGDGKTDDPDLARPPGPPENP